MDIQKIIEVLKSGKETEAKKKLAEYLSEVQLTKRDVGHVYAEIASAYLKANNYLLGNYNAFLREVLKELKELDTRARTLSAR